MTARRLNIVLGVALVVMTMVAAISTGAAIWMARNPGALLAATQALETWPRPVRQAMREALVTGKDAFADDLRAYEQARRTMFEILRADPVDRAGYDAAAADARNAVLRLQENLHRITADTVAPMPPGTRAQIRPPQARVERLLGRFGN